MSPEEHPSIVNKPKLLGFYDDLVSYWCYFHDALKEIVIGPYLKDGDLRYARQIYRSNTPDFQRHFIDLYMIRRRLANLSPMYGHPYRKSEETKSYYRKSVETKSYNRTYRNTSLEAMTHSGEQDQLIVVERVMHIKDINILMGNLCKYNRRYYSIGPNTASGMYAKIIKMGKRINAKIEEEERKNTLCRKMFTMGTNS